MVDFTSTLNSVEKLNTNTTPLTDAEIVKMWKVKDGNIMFVLTVTIEDAFLQQIKNFKTPKKLGTH
ncbi:hypothetical protein H5410_035950 [Solanum commersonii]|uniref:Uncharacterized protein n=1 Tax=Solanum commersonii TaxID=4109 RepID=A0A9J5Y6P5_SOLCO|nr:hypothetical protein H5410_035950 [Solanum commersonii]